MAERYGGDFSPEGASDNARPTPSSPFQGKQRTRAGGRVNFLFFAPLPLAVRAFWQDPTELVLMLTAFGLLILAASLTRAGLIAEDAFNARKVARRPAIPRKVFGSVLTGAGITLAALTGIGGLIGPVLLGGLGAVLHALSFGLDPMKSKGMEGIDQFQTDRVARVVEGAEQHLSAMSDAIKRAGDRKLEARVDRFQNVARKMFRTVEEDPRDLTAARKYLGVYLMGARDATVKFADIYSRNRDAQARADYTTLLDDLEINFASRTEKLLLDDRSDLDVEIEVLRERLARDAIH